MCLSIQFLKIYNVVGAAITMLSGLIGVIFSMILIMKNKAITENSKDNGVKICWALLGTSLTILMFAISFLFGIMKKKKKFILLYYVGLILSMITLFGIAIASSIVPFKMLNQSCTLPLNQQSLWFQNLQNISISANSTFCQTSCPCSIDYQTFQNYPIAYQMNMYAYLPYFNLNNSRFAQTYKQCPQYIPTIQQQSSYNIMQTLENDLKCSGWCNVYITYYFNPLKSQGNFIPKQSCFSSLYKYYREWGVKLAWCSWIIFLLIATNSTMVICYTFHPSRRGGSFYRRLTI